jgi:hypothetical protein
MNDTAAHNTPRCLGCWHLQGEGPRGLGSMRCQADSRRRDVSAFFHLGRAGGAASASHIKEPRPDWCPRLAGGGRGGR